MTNRERLIREYFDTWLKKDGRKLSDIFSPDIVYSECYGPVYRGIHQIKRWFHEWNEQGTVLCWDIHRFLTSGENVVVEWTFACKYKGKAGSFDGVSVIDFDSTGKIAVLKEFQSTLPHYDFYKESRNTLTAKKNPGE